MCWAATQLSQDADTSVRGKITAKGISELYRGTQKKTQKPQTPADLPEGPPGQRDGRGRRRCPRRQRARVCRAAAPGGTPAAPRARRCHLPGAQGAARSPAAVSPRRQRRTSSPSPCGPARRPLFPGAHRPGPAPRPLLRGRPPAGPPRRRSPSPRRRRAAAPR